MGDAVSRLRRRRRLRRSEAMRCLPKNRNWQPVAERYVAAPRLARGAPARVDTTAVAMSARAANTIAQEPIAPAAANRNEPAVCTFASVAAPAAPVSPHADSH